jgi:hypothetical protein
VAYLLRTDLFFLAIAPPRERERKTKERIEERREKRREEEEERARLH